MSFTFVSCFFDINREHKGDGRSIQEYVKWIEQTLKLNANLYIVTEKKFESFFREHMHSNTVLKIIDFTDLHYYKYYKQICDITSSESFKNKIKDKRQCKKYKIKKQKCKIEKNKNTIKRT